MAGEPQQWVSKGVATYVEDHFHGRRRCAFSFVVSAGIPRM